MESVEGLEPEIDAAIAEALQTCIQETDLDVRLEIVTDRTVVRLMYHTNLVVRPWLASLRCIPWSKQTCCIYARGFWAKALLYGQGKVRDTYRVVDSDRIVIVTTDRQSAFDRILASIPFKVRASRSCTSQSAD